MPAGRAGAIDGPAAAVPISGPRPSGGTAVLDDAVAPPWLRMPPARRMADAALARTPAPERPAAPVTERTARRATVHRPPVHSARPPVVEEPGILGLSRLTRGRVGSRLFTLFFVAVFTLIAVQMVLELLHG